ncbi:MAG: DUF4920 domain-containing protein [Proteobacteria bacterium]|nr:DUF4920 domain-containing protein [Pseudomonadota bacterium]
MFRQSIWIAGSLAILFAPAGCSKGTSGQVDTSQGTPSAAKSSAPTPAKTAKGTVYGAGVTDAEAVSIDQLLADPQAYVGKTVQVEGTVSDVCPKRGCWFEMAGQKPGQKLRFKVQDGIMVFPMDAKGKHAVAEGVVSVRTLSPEERRKYLEYQAREYGKDVDPGSADKPMTVVRLDGKGAVIRTAQ